MFMKFVCCHLIDNSFVAANKSNDLNSSIIIVSKFMLTCLSTIPVQ